MLKAPRIGSIPYHGKGVCRHCRQAVPKGRKTWCSQTCVDAALVRKGDPNVVRRLLKERDREVCALCGLDCAQAQRVLDSLSRGYWSRRADDFVAATHFLVTLWTGAKRKGGSLWQADHITPVVEGGGGCDLGGYRTLCCRCHKTETRALAARRAEARRRERQRIDQEAHARKLQQWTGGTLSPPAEQALDKQCP